MPDSPILIVHVFAGTSGLLSGTAAMSFRKGSPRHVLAGKVFVVSMLTMAVLAVYLAIVKHQSGNIGGGILIFYLIGTGWLTAKRRDRETSRFDWIVLLIPLTLGTFTWMSGVKIVRSGASSQDGVPVGLTVGIGQQLSPALFSTPLYLILTVLPLLLLIFWLIRVRFANAYQGPSRYFEVYLRFVSGHGFSRACVASQIVKGARKTRSLASQIIPATWLNRIAYCRSIPRGRERISFLRNEPQLV